MNQPWRLDNVVISISSAIRDPTSVIFVGLELWILFCSRLLGNVRPYTLISL